MPSFNLVDEPWIPCLELDAAGAPTTREYSLRDTLHRAHQLTALAGESPPVTVSLCRLLLAIVHRSCGPDGTTRPADAEDWAALWQAGRFDAAAIDRYLDGQRPNFDLFDERRPFFQTAAPAVDRSKAISMAKLLFQSDNNPLLWDHHYASNPPSVSPAQAARLVVAFQAFDTAGLITGTGAEKSAKAGPLLQAAVLVVRGKNLFETLMLNLHRYSPEDGQPWDFDRANDHPAWEREGDVLPAERYPGGYLDLLTWQSRRMRLWTQVDAAGQTVVQHATVMKGFQIPVDWSRVGRETMIAFIPRFKPQPGQDPNPPLGFREDRALWRDSVALFESQGTIAARPKTFSWLGVLGSEDIISPSQQLSVDAYGLAADRAKLLFWRHERVALPLAYLSDDPEKGGMLRAELRSALRLAEDVGRLLSGGYIEVQLADKSAKFSSPMRSLAQELLGTKGNLGQLIDHLASSPVYWAAIETPFRRFLIELPSDTSEEDGAVTYGAVQWRLWREALRAAATTAFKRATEGLDQSAAGLRAVSLAERELNFRLYQLLGNPTRERSAAGAARR